MFFIIQTCVSIFLLFILICMRGSVETPVYTLLKLRNTKFDKFLSKIRFFVPWGLFCGMNDEFFDIKITAASDKSLDIWFLRKDKKIGNYVFYTDLTSLTLTFYYKSKFKNFLNKFVHDEIISFYHKKNEICNSILIEELWYKSTDILSIKERQNPINKYKLYEYHRNL
jgi:hypothetical protein